MRLTASFLVIAALLTACSQSDNAVAQAGTSADRPFDIDIGADFDEPWAMAFLPGSARALITEKSGKLMLWEEGGAVVEVSGVPKVAFGGQGGLGDVVIAPDFQVSNAIYLSWVEPGPGGTYGAVVGRAILNMEGPTPTLSDMTKVWEQNPKVTGQGHYSHRIVFSPDGKYMFIGSGERQKFDPAQDMNANLGKIVRLNPDGSVPADNPFAGQPSPTDQIWSLGHRNILGLAFDRQGNLWNQEMGPAGGDEINLVARKANYGYPKVSNGDHYDGRPIPDHSDGDGFTAPAVWWNPAISPAGLAYYNADLFPEWQDSLFLGGLSAKALVRVKIDGQKLTKADQWDMGARIREVEVGPDGALWLLEDGGESQGRLLKLTPKQGG